MPPKPKVLTAEQVEQIRQASSYEKISRELGISKLRVRAIRGAVSAEEAMKIAQGDGKTPKEAKSPAPAKPAPSTAKGGEVVTATSRRPGAVVFTLGATSIEVDPQDFYECYILYQDLKAKLGLSSSFSAVLKDSIGMTWRLLAVKPKIVTRETEVIEAQEVQNG